MKVHLKSVLVLGLFCFAGPVHGQLVELCHMFRYETAPFSVMPQNLTFNSDIVFKSEVPVSVEWQPFTFSLTNTFRDPSIFPLPQQVKLKIKTISQEELVFDTIRPRSDLLPDGFMRQNRKGFQVDLPFTDEPATLRFHGGLEWCIGKSKEPARFVFPSSKFGFKYTKKF